MVFCNLVKCVSYIAGVVVTILILIDGFLQFFDKVHKDSFMTVTILILIDGFLQLIITKNGVIL